MKQVIEINYSSVKNQSVLILLVENKKLQALFSSKAFLSKESSKNNRPYSSNYLSDKSLEI